MKKMLNASAFLRKHTVGILINAARAILFILLAFVVIYPFFTQITSMFMTSEDVYDLSVSYIPKHFTLDNIKKAAELLGKQPEDQVTEEDIIKLACHEQGGRKGCPKQAEYIVVLNKADTKERRDRACKIAKCLYENGIKNIFVTSYML